MTAGSRATPPTGTGERLLKGRQCNSLYVPPMRSTLVRKSKRLVFLVSVAVLSRRERGPETAARTLWDPTHGVGFGGAIPERGVAQSGR